MRDELFQSMIDNLAEATSRGEAPALCIGGKADLEHMVKLNMDVHLTILDQLQR